MKRMTRWVVAIGCAALLGLAFAPKANAQGTVEQSSFTLTEPLDVGGTILQPGDYQIKVVLLQGNRNMLRVTNADGTELITTVLSIPHQEGPGAEQIPASRYTYYPASAGHVMALRTWYAADTPGLGGHDIVYPEQRALELAALANEPVVAMPDTVKEADYGTAPLVVVTPAKEVKPYEVAAQAAPVQETVPAQPAKPEVIAAEPASVTETPVEQKQLPKTASDLPLYAGLGVLALVGALGLGVLARRLV
jgi:hypothetical protein